MVQIKTLDRVRMSPPKVPPYWKPPLTPGSSTAQAHGKNSSGLLLNLPGSQTTALVQRFPRSSTNAMNLRRPNFPGRNEEASNITSSQSSLGHPAVRVLNRPLSALKTSRSMMRLLLHRRGVIRWDTVNRNCSPSRSFDHPGNSCHRPTIHR